jgi:hypothetical protein
MLDKYTYPRVSIKTRALPHSSVAPDVEDTTVLFMPLYTERGPKGLCEKNIHTLAEFISIYGELDYELNGQAALNAYNWLTNGGTLCVYRVVMSDEIVMPDKTPMSDEGTAKFICCNAHHNPKDPNHYCVMTAKAKFPGEWYSTLKIVLRTRVAAESIEKTEKFRFDLFIIDSSGTELEAFYNLSLANYKSAISSSNYIENLEFNGGAVGALVQGVKHEIGYPYTVFRTEGSSAAKNKDEEITFGTGEIPTFGDPTVDKINNLISNFWSNTESGAKVALSNVLIPNIDLIMDAGYSYEIKAAMVEFLKDYCNNETNPERSDIIMIMDRYSTTRRLVTPTDESAIEFPELDHLAVYDQYFLVEDDMFTEQDIYVTPSYFLSRLIPANDLQYGIQYPTAGVRRGVLDGVKKVSENPSPSKKQSLFEGRVNYAEKSSREVAFMSQRTHDGSDEEDYTALSFLNNVRVLERMKKDIRRIGREYLFEFNDSTTLSRMSAVLNKYIGGWVANRTLATGVVNVQRNPYSDEAVDVYLTIRFNGTIEVITVDITIE